MPLGGCKSFLGVRIPPPPPRKSVPAVPPKGMQFAATCVAISDIQPCYLENSHQEIVSITPWFTLSTFFVLISFIFDPLVKKMLANSRHRVEYGPFIHFGFFPADE